MPRPYLVPLGSCVVFLVGSVASLRSAVAPPRAVIAQSPESGKMSRHLGRDAAVQASAALSSRHGRPRITDPFFGLDVSRPFGAERSTFRADDWQAFCDASAQEGHKLMVIQARGSKSANPYADLMLAGAREKGFITAAYVFLNFNRLEEPGDYQVREALKAAGSETKHLSFMVVDVESGAAGKMKPAERVNRIGQAVDEVAKAGLRPVIYAKNTGGRAGEWSELTGNADDFSYLPLWVPRYDSLPELTADLAPGNPWEAFGGWDSRAGKQFDGDTTLWTVEGSFPVDKNVFDSSIMQGPTESRPYDVTGMVNVVPGKPRQNPDTGRIEQAVRLTNVGSTAIRGPISIALGDLPTGVELSNKWGALKSVSPADSPYVDTPVRTLNPGSSTWAQLEFESPSPRQIRFRPIVLAGIGAR